jgi:succinate dehydrogenase / fumarate reductase cytochrome b subunit
MSKSGLLKTSVARKFAMALSAFFLLFFLLQHLTINMTSVFSAGTFNHLSHFMGTNFLVQYILQPVLIFGVVFHFMLGFILEFKNRASRDVRYVKYKGGASATWMSRNMLLSGLVILAFLGLHFYDFWIPELKIKFVDGDWSGALTEGGEPIRYFDHLTHKFMNPTRVGIYCVSFVLLALHLMHGFNSAFQSVGANNKYTKALHKFGVAYAILVPAGFIFIALFHHFNH